MSKGHPAAGAANLVLDSTPGVVATIVLMLMEDGSLDICLAGDKVNAQELLPVIRDIEASAIRNSRGGVVPRRDASLGGVPINADAFIDGKIPDGQEN